MELDSIICGKAEDVLQTIPNDSCDLVMTSPPYADRRKGTYGGINPDVYVDWFLPIGRELLRVLKPSGSFMLNIKEGVEKGERQTYVLELVLALKKQGWLWTEEYVWCKKNSFPGKWKNRFRNAWEHCYHFNKNKDFYMDQESVMVPIGDWAATRMNSLSDTDKTRDPSKVGSGFGKCVANWKDRSMVYPTNVLHLATECGNKKHSAAFPVSLPEWFIKLFCPAGGLVIDPFMGSGTTGVAAKQLGRHYIGIEYIESHVAIANERLANTAPRT